MSTSETLCIGAHHASRVDVPVKNAKAGLAAVTWKGMHFENPST
jgi:hypothetical protein